MIKERKQEAKEPTRNEDQNVDDGDGHDRLHGQMFCAEIVGKVHVDVPFSAAHVP